MICLKSNREKCVILALYTNLHFCLIMFSNEIYEKSRLYSLSKVDISKKRVCLSTTDHHCP